MNNYSDSWHSLFLRTVPDDQTEIEVGFLLRQLPIERFRRALDICCGLGRHAVRLAAAGYEVTGIDRDPGLIREARTMTTSNPRYLELDVRRLGDLDESFDAAMILWSSFGYFGRDENDQVVGSVHGLLEAGGRLVLDLYHPAYFETNQGVRGRKRANRHFTESTSVVGSRLRVDLQYDDGSEDSFEWELLAPEELATRAEPLGLRLSAAFANFDEAQPASAQLPRYQAMLEAF